MAVEAHHLNLFHPQLIPGNREFPIPIEGDTNLYSNTQMGYGVPLLSGTTTAETLLPAYNSVVVDSVSMKSDSGVTYNYNLPLPRKRSRECMNMSPLAPKSCGSFSFLGEDISLQIHQQNLEMDRLISQHLEKVRSEVEEKRKRQGRRIIEAIEMGVAKRLKAKEEEMEKMGKLNWALEERVKSLYIENQLWRDMAQTNEAAVNALRTNLEQVLFQRGGGEGIEEAAEAAAFDEDAQSSCGSNEGVDGGQDTGSNGSNGKSRMCRSCGKEESSVLVLPCRHLCLCTVCGSSVHVCPVCKSTKNASVHVNMSYN